MPALSEKLFALGLGRLRAESVPSPLIRVNQSGRQAVRERAVRQIPMRSSHLRFEHDVERGLSRPTQRGEAGFRHDLAQACLAGLRTECGTHLLGQ